MMGAAAYAAAAPTTSTSAERLAALRSEVDDLAQRLEVHQRTSQDELVSLSAERNELMRQIRLEEVRAQTLAQLESERRRQSDGQEERLRETLGPIRQCLHEAKAYVLRTLPYHREERLRVLSHIEADLALTTPDLGHALERLWRFVEEEEALGYEVGHSQQPIVLNGQRHLVEVAHIGMALLYFRTPDGTVGWARPYDGDWTFETLPAPAAKHVGELFALLERNRALGPHRIVIPELTP